ncbi:MAG: sulfatase-like hydrolase/transferase, partial [Planctomycetota bacterium]
HYYDPHIEYTPPEPFASMFKDNLYAGEIAYADHCIGQVITKLKSLGLYDSTLLIITGDHGEGLGDHVELAHSYYIYQESIHVPLIIKLPGQHKAKTVKDVAGLVDITPTVCSLLNLGLPEPIDGKDLSPYLWRETPESEDRYIYSESLIATKYNASPLLAVTGNRFKYIQTARPELYDLIEDPGETRNLVDVQPQRARILQDMLGVMLEESLAADTTDSKLELDDESLKKLESLGYVGGALEEDFSFDQNKADPKDTFSYHMDLMDIMGLIRKKDYDKAEKACQAFISKGLEVPEVYLHLAQIAIEREDEEQAIEYLKKTLALEPGTASAQKHLGTQLLEAERFDEALKHLLKASEIQPRSAEISYFIAKAYYKLGEREKAVEYATRSLDAEPENIEPRTSLAKTLFELGDTRSAIKEYYKVLEYDAENLKALNFLAWIQASSRDEQLRNPKEALKLADYNNAEVMDTLAVAYASVGQFDQAIEKASEAIELAESSGEMALAQRIAKRRGLFQAGKTYNE